MKQSLLVAALLALSVAACSKQEAPKPAETPAAAPAAPAAPAAAPAAPAAPAADAAAPAAAPATPAAEPKKEEAKH